MCFMKINTCLLQSYEQCVTQPTNQLTQPNSPVESSLLLQVWLRKNSLVYIPRGLPDTVRKLHMDSNNIQEIEVGLFSNTSQLDYLTVENNQIKRIQPNTFRGLHLLHTLNFQGNLIQNLEKDTFVDIGNLSTILLSNNPLKRIEAGAFGNLQNLTQLFMSYIMEEDFQLVSNFLPEMPRLKSLYLVNSPDLADALMAVINDPGVTHTPLMELTHLDISYNTFKWISPRIREVFPNLLSLPLDGNPLRCSESLKWLKDWMISSEVSFHSHSEIVCETPSRLKDRPIKNIEDSEWAKDDEADTEVVEASEGGADLANTNQQDAPAAGVEPIGAGGEGQGMAKKSKDEKERRKEKKGKKQEKRSKGDKKGKDRNKRKEKKIK